MNTSLKKRKRCRRCKFGELETPNLRPRLSPKSPPSCVSSDHTQRVQPSLGPGFQPSSSFTLTRCFHHGRPCCQGQRPVIQGTFAAIPSLASSVADNLLSFDRPTRRKPRLEREPMLRCIEVYLLDSFCCRSSPIDRLVLYFPQARRSLLDARSPSRRSRSANLRMGSTCLPSVRSSSCANCATRMLLRYGGAASRQALLDRPG